MHWAERTLLLLLLVVPATGIALVVAADDSVLWLHVAAHLCLFAALGTHVFVVLRRGVLPRMLPGG